MKKLTILSILFLNGLATLVHADPLPAMRRDPSPPACDVSHELFWIADTAKMDRFLAQVDLKNVRQNAYAGEILPDTRAAWRDYVRQARNLAAAGKDGPAMDRILQMLKLSAVYRGFGGFQNVVAGEEIRAAAGQAAKDLNYGGRLTSLYLECSQQDYVRSLERSAGMDVSKVLPEFWQHFVEYAGQNWTRLSAPAERTAAADTVLE